MCFSAPKMPDPVQQDVAPPPPPAPPPPAPTTQGLTIGSQRKATPLENFLSSALGARRSKSPLRIDVGGMSPDGGQSGLSLPQ